LLFGFLAARGYALGEPFPAGLLQPARHFKLGFRAAVPGALVVNGGNRSPKHAARGGLIAQRNLRRHIDPRHRL
jgi:hypothetical protein